MPAFQQVRRVYHSADEMFDLVADVERYHEFVPLCLRHAIVSREVRPDSEILMTNMTVECGIYRESYISRVALDRANGRILVESSDGPLRELRTQWTFQPRADRSCEVGFYLLGGNENVVGRNAAQRGSSHISSLCRFPARHEPLRQRNGAAVEPSRT